MQSCRLMASKDCIGRCTRGVVTNFLQFLSKQFVLFARLYSAIALEAIFFMFCRETDRSLHVEMFLRTSSNRVRPLHSRQLLYRPLYL